MIDRLYVYYGVPMADTISYVLAHLISCDCPMIDISPFFFLIAGKFPPHDWCRNDSAG